MTASLLPIHDSYKVNNTLYAGVYPFDKNEAKGRQKLGIILDFGIQAFIDLTHPNDGLRPYKHLIPQCVEHHSFPIIDNTVADFALLTKIHGTIDPGKKTYVHCKGGYDRTSVIIATYLQHLHPDWSSEKIRDAFLEMFLPYPMRRQYNDRQCLLERRWDVIDDYKNYRSVHDF